MLKENNSFFLTKFINCGIVIGYLKENNEMKNLLIVLSAICAIVLVLALKVLLVLAITYALVWVLGLFGISTFLGFPLFQTLFVILMLCSIIGIRSKSEK